MEKCLRDQAGGVGDHTSQKNHMIYITLTLENIGPGTCCKQRVRSARCSSHTMSGRRLMDNS